MRWECPAGFRAYAAVLLRVCPDAKPAGTSLAFRCPFPDRHRKGGGDARPSAWAKVGGKGELVCRCSACGAGWREFAEYAGLPLPAWFPADPDRPGRAATSRHRRRPAVKSRIVAEYPYTDWRTGELVAVKCRWEPGFEEGRRKDFTWRRPLPAKYRQAAGIPDDAFAWCGGPGVLKGGEFSPSPRPAPDGTRFFRPTTGDDRASYRLEPAEVGPYREWDARRPAAEGRAVVVTEGEGKADLLWSLGFVAVSSPHGKGTWERAWGSLFALRTVLVVPDRDPGEGGLEWAERVVASAIAHGAAGVCLPLVPRDKFPADASVDVKDWLLTVPEAGRAAAFKGLVAKHRMYKRGA